MSQSIVAPDQRRRSTYPACGHIVFAGRWRWCATGDMAVHPPGVRLSVDLDDPEAVPYFLWDEPMNVAELRSRLAKAAEPERLRLLGKILREARDTEVWRFTTPSEVARLWPELQRHLGRRRSFWEFLLGRWQELALDGAA